MIRVAGVMAGVLLVALAGAAQAADPPRVIAAGDWSKPVADKQGRAVRGRLVLCETVKGENRREVAVYVELQDASESIGESMQLFCDLGKNDLRPEYRGGLHCELRDKDHRPVPTSPFAFSGAVPRSEWVSLPTDATIRLRASPFGIYRPQALAIAPHLGSLWVIGDGDAGEYFLSGKFTVDPAAESKPPGEGHVWRGTLVLPPARVVNRPK